MKNYFQVFIAIFFLSAFSLMANASAFIPKEVIEKTTKELVTSFGEQNKFRIEHGTQQVADFWQKEDGTLDAYMDFCKKNFVGDDKKLLALFSKVQNALEVLNGNYNKIGLDLNVPIAVAGYDITPVDELIASYAPAAHLTDDLFQNKLAFIVLLNFPAYSLYEKSTLGDNWSRLDWAYARIGDMFTSRIPASVNQNLTDVGTKAELYISDYNIMMDQLRDEKGKTYFPKGMKLISHWGLRDELKSHYGKKEDQPQQEMVYQVMKRIIDQTIPQAVINNSAYQWNPYSNKVFKEGKEVSSQSEPNTRYDQLVNNFRAQQLADAYWPTMPTYTQRAFEQTMEIPEHDVRNLFVQLLSSPHVKQVASLISKRLGRKLRPYDIWYDGFKPRSGLKEEDLTKTTAARYPNAEAFGSDMPRILEQLGWSAERAQYIASKITVDPARGSGHAAGAYMKGDKARLRTRIAQNGMDYKGYNIAVHEFGHNVEQTIDLYDIDYYMLNGVPNTAFTEAIAFLFQKRDLELLGIKDENPEKEHLAALDAFWSSYEIMGVGLLDMEVWHWMYEHPKVTSAELKEAVVQKAKNIWNLYYAPVFGMKDEPILAIYSHMINYPLYLSNYPVGHLIDFQLDNYFKGKDFAKELDRMIQLGRLTPQAWMKQAVGEPISVKPLLQQVSSALKVVK